MKITDIPKTSVLLILTEQETQMVATCLRGEVENDDGMHGDYMRALNRVLRKIDLVRK